MSPPVLTAAAAALRPRAQDAVGARRRRQRLLSTFALLVIPLNLLYILLPGRFGVIDPAQGSGGLHQWVYAPTMLLITVSIAVLARTRWYRAAAWVAVLAAVAASTASALLVLSTAGLGFEAGLAVGFLAVPALFASVFLSRKEVAVVGLGCLLIAAGLDLGVESAQLRAGAVQAVLYPVLVALLIVFLGARDQAEILAQHRLQENLLDAAGDPILVLDAQSPPWGNAAFEAAFEGSRDEVIAALRRRNGDEREVRLLETQGEEHLFDVTSAEFTGGGRTATIVQLRDTHAREEERAALMVQDRLSTIGLLAGGVAHEANTPLTYLAINVDLALDDLARRDDAAGTTELLLECREGVERLSQLFRDLGAVARTNDAVLEDVSVREVVDASRRLVRGTLRSDAEFEVVGEDAVVRATPTRLSQVLLNLFTNAAAANAEAGGRRIHVEVHAPEPEWVEIAVQDEGPGVPDELRDNLFMPFFTTKDAGDGTGLGLYLSREIVNEFGGDLRLAPPGGGGARFVLRLPAVVAG